MNTIQFGELNSYENFSLILENKTITAPSIKTATVDIPSGDGVLDLTEYFGEINYNNRKLTFEFSTVISKTNFLELFSYIQNTLHGKRMRIYITDDPGFYYYGRINVNEWKSDKRIGKIVIEVDAEPYKYKEEITTIINTISAETAITCQNLHKSVVPTITVNAETTIEFGTYTVVKTAGTYTDDNIVLTQGTNTITATPSSGSVNIKIEYQERGL